MTKVQRFAMVYLTILVVACTAFISGVAIAQKAKARPEIVEKHEGNTQGMWVSSEFVQMGIIHTDEKKFAVDVPYVVVYVKDDNGNLPKYPYSLNCQSVGSDNGKVDHELKLQIPTPEDVFPVMIASVSEVKTALLAHRAKK